MGACRISHAQSPRNHALSVAGVVAALRAEAITLGKLHRRADGVLAVADGTLVAVSGVGCAAAAAAARTLIEAGANALVSWGMAGGLDPKLSSGTICLPLCVVSEDGVGYFTDHHWREILSAAIAQRRAIVGGNMLTSAVSLDNAAAKAAAFRRTGAVAVDMESSAVAQIAALHAMPFVAIRVIVDTSADELPEAALAAVESGKMRLRPMFLALIRRPRDIAPMMRLASRYRAARQALVDVARTGVLAPLSFAAATASRIA